jgi:hypothetical protein
MRDTKLHNALFGAAFLALVSASSTANADVFAISYQVVGESAGYINFNLNAENISKDKVYEVMVTSAGDVTPNLSFGDIEPGDSAGQSVTLTWDSAGEPPALNWTVSYTDSQGQFHTEIK